MHDRQPRLGGQPFIARSPGKIARLRALLDGVPGPSGGGPGAAGRGSGAAVGEFPGEEGAAASGGVRVALEVDGGVDQATAPRCREAGATLFVAGSAIFGARDPGAAYRAIADSIDAV